jgi:hypothetical protein
MVKRAEASESQYGVRRSSPDISGGSLKALLSSRD